MKKIIIILTVCLGILSCQTTNIIIKRNTINPTNLPEADLVTITTHVFINISTIDGKDTDFENLTHKQRSQTAKIIPGVHTFAIKFNNGNVFTIVPKIIVVNLEAGKSYFIEGKVVGKDLKVSCIDTVTKNDVILDMKQLQGNARTTISTYIKYILNPTMESNNKTVQIENEKTRILFKPDMTFIMTDIGSEKTTIGYSGFTVSFSMDDGKVFLFETDVTKMTKDEFLNKSDYTENAQIVLLPIKCTETSVTYKYLKPESLQNQEVIFSIKHL